MQTISYLHPAALSQSVPSRLRFGDLEARYGKDDVRTDLIPRGDVLELALLKAEAKKAISGKDFIEQPSCSPASMLRVKRIMAMSLNSAALRQEFDASELAFASQNLMTWYEAKELLDRLFAEGEYKGPKPQVLWDGEVSFGPCNRYLFPQNAMLLNGIVTLSSLYHELTHYEGALDIAVAKAWHNHLPLFKRWKTKAPRIPVSKTLVDYVKRENRHLDPGWVQLGYETDVRMVEAAVAGNLLQAAKKEKKHLEAYEQAYRNAKEELIANLTCFSKVGDDKGYSQVVRRLDQTFQNTVSAENTVCLKA